MRKCAIRESKQELLHTRIQLKTVTVEVRGNITSTSWIRIHKPSSPNVMVFIEDNKIIDVQALSKLDGSTDARKSEEKIQLDQSNTK